MSTRCVTINPDGRVTEVECDGLHDLQEQVGGLIEHVGTDRFDAYVNEEGRILGLPDNPTASFLLSQSIVGPAVFTGPADDEGTTPTWTTPPSICCWR